MIVSIIIGILTVCVFVYIYFKWTFTHWRRKNVAFLPPTFPFGNLENPFSRRTSLPLQVSKMYHDFRRQKAEHAGIYVFGTPVYLPMNLDTVKNILTRDWQHFNSRGVFHVEYQPISMHLFSLEGDRWKNLRRKLTPTFTSGKLKMLCPSVISSAEPLKNEVAKFSGKSVNIKDLLAKFTMNVIGSCAFGLDCNTFEPEGNLFMNNAVVIVKPNILEALKGVLTFAFPNFSEKVHLKPFRDSAADFFSNLFVQTVTYRQDNNAKRNDYMQLLINMLNKDNPDEYFDLNDLQAQAFIFFIAGYETSSSTSNFALYELARNLDIQNKVRKEIMEVLSKHGGEITYEGLQEMKYLTQVIEETLRMYPVVPVLSRKCTDDYKIPDSDIKLKKGDLVLISNTGIQRDEEYYPQPNKFDPDRFSDQNKPNINQYSILRFGEGPRFCIGARFAIMQTKIGLVTLLKNFKFTLSDDLMKKSLKFGHFFLLATEDDMLLNVEAINN